MKRNDIRTLSMSIWLSLGLASMANDGVQVWAEKMQASLESAHHAKLEGSMHIEQAGVAVNLKMAGTITYKNRTHSRMKINMSMELPGTGEGTASQRNMTMKMVTVQDGEFAWSETHMSMMSHPSVTKAKVGQDITTEDMLGIATPMSQIEELQEHSDLRVLEENESKVVLGGTLDQNAIRSMKLGEGTHWPYLESIIYRIEIDAKTAFPIAMTLTADGKSLLEFFYKDVQVLDPDSIPDSAFRYVPPPGVDVKEL